MRIFRNSFFAILVVSGLHGICGDHLEPEAGVFSGRALESYHETIERLLLPDRERKIQLVTLASFKKEEAVYVIGYETSPKIRCLSPKKKIWDEIREVVSDGGKKKAYSMTDEAARNAGKKLSSGVNDQVGAISKETLKALENVWEAALLQVKYDEKKTFGLDGTTYHFLNWSRGNGFKEGQIWSPKGKNMMALVKLGSDMCRFTEATEKNRAELEGKLQKDANSLLSDLKSRR